MKRGVKICSKLRDVIYERPLKEHIGLENSSKAEVGIKLKCALFEKLYEKVNKNKERETNISEDNKNPLSTTLYNTKSL